MPQRKSGITALRKNRTQRMRNLDIKTDLKKTLKSFAVLVTDKKKSDAEKQLSVVFKKLDKAAKRNIMHVNKAARHKSQAQRQLSSIQ